jgi:hypothetical protein
MVCFLVLNWIQIYPSHEELFRNFESEKSFDSDLESSTRRNSYLETELHRFDTRSELTHSDTREFKKDSGQAVVIQEPQEDDDSREHQENFIRIQLNRLPEEKRPVISLALQNMKEGQKAFDSIEQGEFFDAVQAELDRSDKSFKEEFSEAAHASAQILNASDENFWSMIENDSKNKVSFLKNMAKKLQVDDDLLRLLFSSPDYNMYFRLEYLRLKLDRYSKKESFFQRLEKAYIKIVVKIQWYLYKEAILQGKIFTSGMITFKDTNDRCFKFLEGYIELVSPGYRNQGSFASLLQSKGYLRISSHYKGQTALEGKNYGIDLTDAIKKEIGLPSGKGHILFGMRSNGMTFVKWEDYGTTFNPSEGEYSVIPHMFSLFRKLGKSDNDMEFRESDMKSMKVEFKRIYGKKLSETDRQLVESEGIAGMKKILDRLPEATALEKTDKAEKIEAFERAFAHDFGNNDVKTISDRKGSEVVLDFNRN